jgi:hypothetical protein
LQIRATAIADDAAWDALSLGIEPGARAGTTSDANAGCAVVFPRKPTIVHTRGRPAVWVCVVLWICGSR